MFSINPNSGEPIYRQLTEQIKRMVAGGQLRAGDALPSVRELAAHYAVNPMTISKAYSLLEAEGILERQRGKPMTVAAQKQSKHSEQARLQQIMPQLEALATAAHQLQLSKQSVLFTLTELLDQTHDEP
ncbi:GntR family transcriptional regulator [Alkalimonas sp. MEB108]|uniref:GntR family transcriptional regulator n=1 Tax=Alkalimonas cellulosilytica TaxID=3058395 RepID=A0ABU7J7Z0_9GAMM|nr:GntR family transcriptional regulator [Alkalimonas sp. MEB108]MEE2002666.1 GntR family transcriptional regulator [Alkalimonas sp. MEB108]